MPHRVCRQAPLHSSLKLSSLALQRRHIMCLVLNAAAACPDFGRRTARAHYLQPPPQLRFPLSQHSLAIASLQLWFRDNKQRGQLLCCSGALFDLVFRLARAANKQESRFFEFEVCFIATIMRRCFSVYAWRRRNRDVLLDDADARNSIQ